MAKSSLTATGQLFRLEGMEQLQRQLAKAPDVVKKHVAGAIPLSALRIANRARDLVPVQTGLLKREIGWQHEDGELEGYVGIRSRSAFYWAFVEFGTVKQSAKPFFRPAAEEGQAGFVLDVARTGPDIENELKE